MEERLKKRHLCPLPVLAGRIAQLQELVDICSDPYERIVLVKRVDNLKAVMKFLASTESDPAAAGGHS